MNRTGLAAMACVLIAVPLAGAACGSDDGGAAGTLPPIATTTTSTILITTTTTWVPITYEIKAGDSLQAIADKFGVDIEKLAVLNGISNRNDIDAGDVLDIPPPTTTSSTLPSTTS